VTNIPTTARLRSSRIAHPSTAPVAGDIIVEHVRKSPGRIVAAFEYRGDVLADEIQTQGVTSGSDPRRIGQALEQLRAGFDTVARKQG
jgi:hypothetical protein